MAEVRLSSIIEFLGDRVVGSSLPEDPMIGGQSSLVPGAVGCLSFAGRSTAGIRAGLTSTQASAVLVLPELLAEAREELCCIAVEQPRLEFARVGQRFFVERPDPRIATSAVIHQTVTLGEDALIGPGAVVGEGCVIGDRVRLGANCVIGAGAHLGDDVTVGPGTVIGHDGFGYARESDGTPVLLPHSGSVRIGDRVDIGANTAIDRGTVDDTVIEDDAKIDNLVHVAHNCRIGRGAFVIATAILCGGVRVGDEAWVAPNAAVREQLVIGERATVGLSATVVKNVEPATLVVGSPAQPLVR